MPPGAAELARETFAVEQVEDALEAVEHALVVGVPPRNGHAAPVEIVASAETTAQTGVEMEALVAASVAALTLYDMAKAIDSSMEIAEVRLLEKTKS